MKYIFDEIESIECVGEFNDEYVYDLDMEDDSHTFIANDILVHNSCYVTFQEALEKVNWTGHINEFVLTLNEYRLEKYLKDAFNKYSKYYNTDSYLDFELESIAYNGIWTAKKKYVQELSWFDGKVYNRLEKIKATGLDMIQASTPSFCRQVLVDVVAWLFNNGRNFKISDLAKQLSDIKQKFLISDIEDISKNTSVGDYNKFILNDKEYLEIGDKCPAHVNGAGVHNHLLNKNPNLKTKYELIRSGDKVKWYYSKNDNKFSFKGDYPKEFAPPIDYDTQFEKTLLGPVNNIIVSMQYKPLTANLHTAKKLF